MNILVTGGAGFIGSHLADSLLEDGYEVDIIDNLSTGKRSNVNPKANFYPLDILEDRGKVYKLFKEKRYQYVFHLAAMARIPECLDYPIKSFQINTGSTLWLLQTAREWGVRGFIFSSSSSVYGEVGGAVYINEETPLRPISLYGLHKLASEQMALMYHKFYSLNTVALRYFNVYGTARQSSDGAYPNVFSAFARDSKKGQITIFGDGEHRRDFIHVYDVVKANKYWIDKTIGWGEAYNVGTGETHTINEVASYFPVKIDYKPARVGDPLYSCASNQKFGGLGYIPEVSFKEGVNIYLESLKQNER